MSTRRLPEALCSALLGKRDGYGREVLASVGDLRPKTWKTVGCKFEIVLKRIGN